jgi:N-methylhydantoinase B/oxoprolinase/acetone carboxylase alpha subunit
MVFVIHQSFLPQGCLNPVKTIIPRGSILDPSENAAVVGGNVLTSQRIVDVILKAFQICAASQVHKGQKVGLGLSYAVSFLCLFEYWMILFLINCRKRTINAK